jgi:hypothetical protein
MEHNRISLLFILQSHYEMPSTTQGSILDAVPGWRNLEEPDGMFEVPFNGGVGCMLDILT